MGKKKKKEEKKKKSIDIQTLVANALIDLIVGALLVIIDNLLD